MKSIKWQSLIPLREKNTQEYVPSIEQIIEYGQYIGLQFPGDQQLLYIAKEGINASLPQEWEACQTPQGDMLYRNLLTRQIQQEHPLDELYRKRVIELKSKQIASYIDVEFDIQPEKYLLPAIEEDKNELNESALSDEFANMKKPVNLKNIEKTSIVQKKNNSSNLLKKSERKTKPVIFKSSVQNQSLPLSKLQSKTILTKIQSTQSCYNIDLDKNILHLEQKPSIFNLNSQSKTFSSQVSSNKNLKQNLLPLSVIGRKQEQFKDVDEEKVNQRINNAKIQELRNQFNDEEESEEEILGFSDKFQQYQHDKFLMRNQYEDQINEKQRRYQAKQQQYFNEYNQKFNPSEFQTQLLTQKLTHLENQKHSKQALLSQLKQTNQLKLMLLQQKLKRKSKKSKKQFNPKHETIIQQITEPKASFYNFKQFVF